MHFDFDFDVADQATYLPSERCQNAHEALADLDYEADEPHALNRALTRQEVLRSYQGR